MNIEKIAQVVHETNRVYCESIGDYSQETWGNAPLWQKESAISGVKFVLENPNAPDSAQHEAWLKDKYADDWKYGEVKDVKKKENPCCVPYNELPIEQKVKDSLFIGIVRAMSVLLGENR